MATNVTPTEKELQAVKDAAASLTAFLGVEIDPKTVTDPGKTDPTKNPSEVKTEVKTIKSEPEPSGEGKKESFPSPGRAGEFDALARKMFQFADGVGRAPEDAARAIIALKTLLTAADADLIFVCNLRRPLVS